MSNSADMDQSSTQQQFRRDMAQPITDSYTSTRNFFLPLPKMVVIASCPQNGQLSGEDINFWCNGIVKKDLMPLMKAYFMHFSR